MIKVNLLPGIAPKSALKYDLFLFLFVFAVTLTISAGIYLKNEKDIVQQKRAIGNMKKEIASLDRIYQEYSMLEKEKTEMQRRIQAIEALKKGRALVARTLYDLTTLVREGVWLKSFKKGDAAFELEGRSLEDESISRFMEALSKVPYIRNMELKNVEIVTENGVETRKFVIQGNIGL